MQNEIVYDDIIKKIDNCLNDGLDAIRSASTLHELENIRVHFLGKKGRLTDILKELGDLPGDVRPRIGKEVNQAKDTILQTIKQKSDSFREDLLKNQLKAEAIDITLPGRGMYLGNLHPITLTGQRLEALFTSAGFEVVEGPEIENEYYNFEALNIPANHPARDMHDTFYIGGELLLRTHTSPVQIRAMETRQPPLRVIAPGRAFRCDSDQTHTPMFHQLEGLVLGEDVTFTNLKQLLQEFLADFFEKEVILRFRPSYFPFTEPSAEVDIKTQSGWLELLGCGMVHPEVLKHVNIDSEKFTGFAFGLGIDRLAMIRYDVPDLRLFFENDIRFLSQF
jgi:phenylalanyl-tRNA synthetase alpha chain